MKNDAYEIARNKLTPEAERIANAKVKKLSKAYETRTGADGESFRWSFFDEFFHGEMKRLAEGLK